MLAELDRKLKINVGELFCEIFQARKSHKQIPNLYPNGIFDGLRFTGI